jgi:hypothetical protein
MSGPAQRIEDDRASVGERLDQSNTARIVYPGRASAMQSGAANGGERVSRTGSARLSWEPCRKEDINKRGEAPIGLPCASLR